MPHFIQITCPACDSEKITKAGFTKQNKQRYCCQNTDCNTKSFIINYSYRVYQQGVKEQILEMAINGGGITDTVRVLKVAKNTIGKTILNVYKKLSQINPKFLIQDRNKPKEVRFIKAPLDAELDEQWSYVQKKSNQRWLWYAIDHDTNTVLAFEFGRRKDAVFKKLKKKLSHLNIKTFYTDDWGAYKRNLEANSHCIGKANTQKIERKNLNFRTRIKRLARKTICFSKCKNMHDAVISLYINAVEFGVDLHAKLHI